MPSIGKLRGNLGAQEFSVCKGGRKVMPVA